MSAEFYKALAAHFETLENQLNQLDAATGDGDHGVTIVKGLHAVADAVANAEQDTPPARAFRRAAGGASGSLFSLIIGALDNVLQHEKGLSEELHKAAARISELGEAVAGDKTMLDALLPAAHAQSLDDAAAAARQGADSTVEMSAKRGRAKYVEGAGVGHIDAGAVSVAEILAVFADYHKSKQFNVERTRKGSASQGNAPYNYSSST